MIKRNGIGLNIIIYTTIALLSTIVYEQIFDFGISSTFLIVFVGLILQCLLSIALIGSGTFYLAIGIINILFSIVAVFYIIKFIKHKKSTFLVVNTILWAISGNVSIYYLLVYSV
ncbi:hypothetical protein EW093_15640 [Thiospirochaeta perfilievii]|uniref:Uncharacterized protein n=1 Tax=Thiospirochaeta perfilievii TaxID=252967 RepID=A0A5C1QF70_9SPIO|nr:hypothetical protein [Thiospirochaeta perfilievii]QEN06058.1 hypothetical protein EW093_15640 [Thiospirochaeta perfilievii]